MLAMTTSEKIDSIVTRHHADSVEGDRVCRACGRPWPCDVQQLAVAVSIEGPSVTAVLASRDRVWRAARGVRVHAEATTA
jgi:hypothetical protein